VRSDRPTALRRTNVRFEPRSSSLGYAWRFVDSSAVCSATTCCCTSTRTACACSVSGAASRHEDGSSTSSPPFAGGEIQSPTPELRLPFPWRKHRSRRVRSFSHRGFSPVTANVRDAAGRPRHDEFASHGHRCVRCIDRRSSLC